MHVVVVAAARPNFMKVAPVLDALERRDVTTTLVHTGQHYDEAMSGALLRDLAVRDPDVHLGCGGGQHSVMTARVMAEFDPVLERVAPDALVVVGDVNSTLACALVAAKRNVPVAHVEAGLRSRDRTMPEEVNRLVVDQISDWLLTPSADATANLLAEGVAPGRIYEVGNVMVDTLRQAVARVDVDAALARFGVARGGYALLTLHRPSNVDDPQTLAGLLHVVSGISRELPVLFAVHPRTAPRLRDAVPAQLLEESPGIRLLPPQGYLDNVALMSGAAVVLTDSGGMQEETSVLGVPCLTLRETTERPVTVTHGTNTVVGTDPVEIAAAFRRLASGEKRTPRLPAGWDGRAADRIAAVLTTVTPPLDVERAGTRVFVIPDGEAQAVAEEVA